MPGKGYKHRHDQRKISVLFDRDTFDTLYKAALKQKTSIAEQVRVAVEVGLETLKEDMRDNSN